ncbi:MAG: hypothetical protein EBV06_02210 [Planctomycetia bacterium]|nr:hypothetical protein [Planctomycetia bacterium]
MAEGPNLDVLAVAPHPDDLEILCGGTLAKLVLQGHRVAILDLTTGEPTPRGTIESRAAEAEEARRILGIPQRLNLGLPNRELMDCSVVIGAAGRTPAASPDHYQGQLLIEAARFWSQLTKWDDRFENTLPWRIGHFVYACFPFDAEVRHWPGSFVIDISDTFEQKMQAVKAYRSQFDETRFDRVRHMIEAHNATAGSRCGFAYGESFHLPQPVGGADLFALVTGAKASSTAPVPLPGQPPPPLK